MKTTDLGNDWYANEIDDGSMTLRNSEKGQRIDLPADSVLRLRRIIVQAAMRLVDKTLLDAFAEPMSEDEKAARQIKDALACLSPAATPAPKRYSDGGQRIVDGLTDVIDYLDGDESAATLVTASAATPVEAGGEAVALEAFVKLTSYGVTEVDGKNMGRLFRFASGAHFFLADADRAAIYRTLEAEALAKPASSPADGGDA